MVLPKEEGLSRPGGREEHVVIVGPGRSKAVEHFLAVAEKSGLRIIQVYAPVVELVEEKGGNAMNCTVESVGPEYQEGGLGG